MNLGNLEKVSWLRNDEKDGIGSGQWKHFSAAWLGFFNRTFIGVRFPVANLSGFFYWNRWFQTSWEWKKMFSSYVANKKTVLGISVMKCFPTNKAFKNPTTHIAEKFLSNAVFLFYSVLRIFFIPNLYCNELSPTHMLLTNIVPFAHWKEETAYCSYICKQ